MLHFTIHFFSNDKVNFNTLIAVTAQHREMLDQALKLFNIDPDFDLDLMSHNQSLQSLTSKILNGISDLLIETKPDVILNIGFKSDGLVNLNEFRDDPKLNIGDEVKLLDPTKYDKSDVDQTFTIVTMDMQGDTAMIRSSENPIAQTQICF